MDTTTLDFNTVTLMVTIAGSWLTIVGLIIHQSNRLDNKIDNKIDTKIDALGGDVSDIGQRVARIEGHLMGPESFSPRPLTPPTDEPGDGERPPHNSIVRSCGPQATLGPQPRIT